MMAAGARAAVKLSLVLVAVFGVLLGRLYWLQVLPQREHVGAVAAQTQRPVDDASRLLVERPYRGRILDREGRVLASSWYAHDLVLDGKELISARGRDDRHEAAQRASLLIRQSMLDAGVPCDEERVHGRVYRAVLDGDAHCVVARGLDPDAYRRLEGRLRRGLRRGAQPAGQVRLRGAGVRFVPRLRRSNPWGEVTSQVVGLVGEAEHDANERIAGRTGLEYMAEELLTGAPGALGAEGYAAGRRLIPRWYVQRDVVGGSDVVLTLDAVIQSICMEELRRSVTERKAAKGTAVVLSARTGEVLALASYPTASPSLEPGERAVDLNAGGLVDLYEPGSVIKPLLVAWGLEQGALNLEASWDCGGADGAHVFVDGRRRRVVREYRANPEPLTTAGVIIKSSNVGSCRILMSLGLKRAWGAFQAFGVGGRLDVAYPSNVRARYTTERMVREHSSYSALNSACSFAQGYEIMLSPLGMARMYLPMAGDGTMPEPTLVRAVRSEERESMAPASRRRVLREDVALRMRQVLTQVVEEGTGKVLRGMRWTAAAKTGTPKIMRTGLYNPVICAMAPAGEPELVVTVIHQDVSPRLAGGAYTGGRISGPVARGILERALQYMEVPADR